MLRNRGRMHAWNFKSAVEESCGLRLGFHEGYSRGQFAQEGGTLAAARSGQEAETETSLEPRPDRTARQAKEAGQDSDRVRGQVPRLGLMYFSLDEAREAERGTHIRLFSPDETVASSRAEVANGDVLIHGNTSAGTIEPSFRADHGLHVQGCFLRERKPV